MASRKHRRLIRFWPHRDQSPKFYGLYNLRRLPRTTGTIGGMPRTITGLNVFYPEPAKPGIWTDTPISFDQAAKIFPRGRR